MTDPTNELGKLGVDALKDLLTNLTQAKGFILEQAPEFCQQLVARGAADCIIGGIAPAFWILFGACLLLLTVVLIFRNRKEIWSWSEPGACVLFLIPGILVIGSSFTTLMDHVRGYVGIQVAPKVYLVETITRMVK